MSKHTPGPWKYSDNRGDRAFDYSPGADGTFNILADKFDVVAKCLTESDGRLIAASPELLEELKIAVMNCPCSLAERDSGHIAHCRAPIWQALIDKAEGRE